MTAAAATTMSTSMSTANLKKIQATSGLFMAIYVAMHLTNHYFLNISYDQADSIMRTFRHVYQNPVF
jgi:DMSO/TMAO reductase YedYZ heme-binding membrane subunit